MLWDIVPRILQKARNLVVARLLGTRTRIHFFDPLGRFKREKCVCIKFIQQMDKFIAYFIQLNKYIKTLNPCEIRASRSFLIVEIGKTEGWVWEMIRHHRLNQGGS